MTMETRILRARRLLAGVEKNHSAAVLESSFGAEDMVVLDLIARDGLAIGVATVDTGRLPAQTLDFIGDVRRRYGIEVSVHSPWPDSVAAYVEQHGADGFYEDVAGREACCAIRRAEPLRRLLAGKRGWVTAARSAPDGGPVEESSRDATLGIWKFHPLAGWSEDDVWTYLHENGVPYHPLHKQGYATIGCEPCTRALRRGELPQAARWWWEQPGARAVKVVPIRAVQELAA
jgi:phosphoadenosine phosphosulfate reductase